MKHARCTVCSSPLRHDLESQLADGARVRPLARKYNINYDRLWRHWRGHVTPEQKDRLRFGDAPTHMLKGMVADAEISVLKDLDYARKSIVEALDITPREDANARGTLTGRLHENARIRGQITGELAKSPLLISNNLTVIMDRPEMREFLDDMARELARFPEAAKHMISWIEAKESQAIEAVGHAGGQSVSQALPALEHRP